jgi:radical SAM superfamily enzyme YgiQ (UPF0313 family)
MKIRNHIALELFSPAGGDFLRAVASSIRNFDIEISPESHDERVRRRFGRNYGNAELEECVRQALELGCRRIDMFFMAGLPEQTPESVLETVEYCGRLLAMFPPAKRRRLHPFVSPLAPFLDPGSRAFESPEEFGYRLFHRSLEEHRQALLQPSWGHVLNYETKWMSREQLVEVTYEAALRLNRLKVQYGVEKPRAGGLIEQRIRQMQELTEATDGAGQPGLGAATICRKSELQWPMAPTRFGLLGVLRALAARKRPISRPTAAGAESNLQG